MMSVRLYIGICGLICWMLPTLPSGAQDAAPAAEATADTKASPDTDEKKAVATRQAEEWLALVDNGKFHQSWDTASPFLRNHYEREHWVRAMTVAIPPLGAVQSRSARSVEYYDAMPGGPTGHYFILRYDTVFANRSTAEESVTVVWQPKESRWRVVGYFVK